MRRRALLAVAATVPLAGCPTPPWGDSPETAEGVEVTVRREHTGEFEPDGPGDLDAGELHRALDADPPRLTVRGRLLGGARECYRVDLVETDLTASRLLFRLTIGDDRPWDDVECPDVAELYPYEIAVTFSEATVPDRVEVRHDDEVVLEEPVTTE
ncbi:hypothetical protein DQW50_16680 [Halorubrum sp. 48-1-W]|uniref:hypothetical protein n=1 Tax=Halorubrum sp. 48-1-W TaxID=2249761 RepID=UPI000DCB7503|nr:hypothetical protein [Halorubrum sp. 48-1-W]RAW43999.1 hypothetical protein DQW50_16680 [Halorubrum sp. 48-1-W]